MLSVHLDYNFCQPKKLSWAHADQEPGRIAGMVALLLRYPAPCQTAEFTRKGAQTASQRGRGLPHVGAAALACGHERCNQAWGISAWLTMSDCWNAQTSKRSTWAMGVCLWALIHFDTKRRTFPNLSINRGDAHFSTCGSFYPKLQLNRNTVFFITVRLGEFKCSIIGKSTGPFKKRLEVNLAFTTSGLGGFETTI